MKQRGAILRHEKITRVGYMFDWKRMRRALNQWWCLTSWEVRWHAGSCFEYDDNKPNEVWWIGSQTTAELVIGRETNISQYNHVPTYASRPAPVGTPSFGFSTRFPDVFERCRLLGHTRPDVSLMEIYVVVTLLTLWRTWGCWRGV